MYLSIMKVLISETQYVTLMEDIKKEQYKELVLNLLETLFGELTIKDEYDGRGKKYIQNIYDQHGEDIASIFLGDHANKGCKKDLTLNQETSERLEGYIPYFRHKMFSKVIVDYIYDKFKIKCDCVHYDYNFEREIRYIDDDGEEYEDLNYDTRKYNVKKKKKIKESVDKNKKFLIDVMGMDFTDKIQQITSSFDVPRAFIGECFSRFYINKMMNFWGPMYLFEIDGIKFLYQDRYDIEWFIDEICNDFVDDEIPEKLGIGVLGLKFSDILDMYFEEEEDTFPLNESVDKNKKFLIDVMGIDFTDKIEEVKDLYDVPLEFGETIGPDYIRRVLNYFGPMYLVDIDGKKYLYQYRIDEEDGDFEWFHDEHGFNYVDGEIPEQLGISEMGLKFSDIIDIFFFED